MGDLPVLNRGMRGRIIPALLHIELMLTCVNKGIHDVSEGMHSCRMRLPGFLRRDFPAPSNYYRQGYMILLDSSPISSYDKKRGIIRLSCGGQ